MSSKMSCFSKRSAGMRRKIFCRLYGTIMILFVLVGSLLINACSDNNSIEATPTRQETTEITLAFTADPGATVLYNMLNSQAVEKATGIKVKTIELTYQDAYQQEIDQAKTGKATYDIFMIDDPWLPEFASNGYLVDLTQIGYKPDKGFITNTLEPGYWPPRSGPRLPGDESNRIPHMYALPVIGDVQMFMYRKDMFHTKINSWNDVLQEGQQITNPAENTYLMAIRGTTSNVSSPIVADWFSLLYSFGGQVFDDQWRPAFNSPEGVSSLEFLLELMKYAPAKSADFDSSQQIACYIEGQCLTTIAWTGTILAAEDPSQSKVVEKNAWIGMPMQETQASMLGLFMIGIGKGSQKQEAALKVIQWLTSDEFQIAFARQRGIPVRVNAFEDQASQKEYPWLPAVKIALDSSIVRPRTPEWGQIEIIIGEHLHQALIGREIPQYALNQAAQEVTDFLEQKGYYK